MQACKTNIYSSPTENPTKKQKMQQFAHCTGKCMHALPCFIAQYMRHRWHINAQSPNQQSSSYLSKSMQLRLAVIYDAWRSLCLPLHLQMREACLRFQFAAA
ncbi:TPA: hypothetical protein ACH3X3_009980 [Trebouxia sp. C0006]